MEIKINIEALLKESLCSPKKIPAAIKEIKKLLLKKAKARKSTLKQAIRVMRSNDDDKKVKDIPTEKIAIVMLLASITDKEMENIFKSIDK